ncbi:acyltransferase [Cetobacterium somerae]|uniref:acyltransferase n=1 Tax=Cetobacterium somerae TaxID=188913 RepID=UPI0038920107
MRIYQNTEIFGIGKVEIGDNTFLGFRYGGGYKGRSIELQVRKKESEIILGKNIGINNGLFICCAGKVEIEDSVLIGSNVTIMDHNAHGIKPEERRSRVGTIKNVKIEKNAWLGNNVTILPGVKIGENSIIGAGAVVYESIPPNKIAYGNPCKIKKNLD